MNTKSSSDTGGRRATQAVFHGIVLALLIGAGSLRCSAQSSGTAVRYDQGNPTDSEQYLLVKLNRARMDPVGEGQRLDDWLRNTTTGKAIVAQYGISPDQVKADFAALPAVPPVALDPSLLAATRAHSADLAAHGGVGPNGDAHAGYDGSTVITRDQAAGYLGACQGEDVVINASSLDTVHAGLCVDWGVPNLGHRMTRMDGSQDTKVVGVGLANLPSSAYIETEDFGAPPLAASHGAVVITDAPALLTGVVYRDANGNGQYDPGEGIAGVAVTMDGGSYYAVTTSSGGYALPLVNADGSYADSAATVRMKFADGTSVSETVFIMLYNTASFGAYRANVEWDVNTASSSQAAFFNGSAALGQGWNYLAFVGGGNVFGYYNTSLYPYLFHNDLGWEYVLDAQDGRQGVYLYDFASSDWWYTSPTFAFPYLYDFTRRAVLYYYPDPARPGFYNQSPRQFFDFAAEKIIPL